MSSNSTIATLIAELKTKLSDRARDDLDRLISSPEAETLIARDEEQTLAARRELAARLKLVADGKHSQQRAAAGKRCETAARAVESAEIQLRVARENFVAATAACLAADRAEADERFELERELRATADPRLAELAIHCGDLDGMCRSAFAHHPVTSRNWLTRELTILTVTNREEVDAARAALHATSHDMLRMQLQALASQDVTDAIAERLHTLEPLLAAVSLNIVTIDENGQLKLDRTLPQRVLVNRAIRANGGSTDVPDEIDAAPALTRARRHITTLQA